MANDKSSKKKRKQSSNGAESKVKAQVLSTNESKLTRSSKDFHGEIPVKRTKADRAYSDEEFETIHNNLNHNTLVDLTVSTDDECSPDVSTSTKAGTSNQMVGSASVSLVGTVIERGVRNPPEWSGSQQKAVSSTSAECKQCPVKPKVTRPFIQNQAKKLQHITAKPRVHQQSLLSSLVRPQIGNRHQSKGFRTTSLGKGTANPLTKGASTVGRNTLLYPLAYHNRIRLQNANQFTPFIGPSQSSLYSVINTSIEAGLSNVPTRAGWQQMQFNRHSSNTRTLGKNHQLVQMTGENITNYPPSNGQRKNCKQRAVQQLWAPPPTPAAGEKRLLTIQPTASASHVKQIHHGAQASPIIGHQVQHPLHSSLGHQTTPIGQQNVANEVGFTTNTTAITATPPIPTHVLAKTDGIWRHAYHSVPLNVVLANRLRRSAIERVRRYVYFCRQAALRSRQFRETTRLANRNPPQPNYTASTSTTTVHPITTAHPKTTVNAATIVHPTTTAYPAARVHPTALSMMCMAPSTAHVAAIVGNTNTLTRSPGTPGVAPTVSTPVNNNNQKSAIVPNAHSSDKSTTTDNTRCTNELDRYNRCRPLLAETREFPQLQLSAAGNRCLAYRCQSLPHRDPVPGMIRTCKICSSNYTIACGNIADDRLGSNILELECPKCWNSNACYCGEFFSDRYVSVGEAS